MVATAAVALTAAMAAVERAEVDEAALTGAASSAAGSMEVRVAAVRWAGEVRMAAEGQDCSRRSSCSQTGQTARR